MNRRGIALLATLWLLAALSTIALGAVTLARMDRGVAMNRIALTRGRWAAEGCLAILQGAAEQDGPLAALDSVSLGAGLWCRATIEDPGARVKLDIVDAPMLSTLVSDPARSAALLDWLDADDLPREHGAEAEWYQANGLALPRNGPIPDIDELGAIAGFDSAVCERLRPFLTTSGTGRVDVNDAPLGILRLLPGLEEAATVIVARRSGEHPPRDLDDLLGGLPASLRVEAAAHYGELQGLLAFAPEHLILHLEGHVAEAALVTRTNVEVVPTAHRLALLSREEW